MGERLPNLSLQNLRPGQESIASDLVMRSYRAASTTNDSAEGVEEFTRYASAARIRTRITEGSVVVMAFLGAAAIGVVEIRRPGHIGRLFICPDNQGRGVGRSLCETAVETAARMLPRPPKVTVKSAPGAVAFYEKLGFLAVGAMTEFNGIRFVPMEREVDIQTDANPTPGEVWQPGRSVADGRARRLLRFPAAERRYRGRTR